MLLKAKTESLCSVCFKTISAKVFSQDGKVFIENKCPRHGIKRSLLESDEVFYKRFVDCTPASFSVRGSKIWIKKYYIMQDKKKMMHRRSHNIGDLTLQEYILWYN